MNVSPQFTIIVYNSDAKILYQGGDYLGVASN